MHPSEMTDEQLRLAIAKELGCYGFVESPRGLEGHFHVEDSQSMDDSYGPIPNYPGDPNAALGLPLETNDEKRKFAIELAKIIIPDVNIGTAGIVYEARFATARQHSEAWLTARRNNANTK